MIAIVNTGSGNLRSVQKALELFYPEIKIIDTPKSISSADGMVLPGVGSFGDAVDTLNEIDLFEEVKELGKSIPVLGICLGMQILFERSEESPDATGLGLLRGEVLKLHPLNDTNVPHTGWNRLIPQQKEQKIENLKYAYFNHSYYCHPEDENVIDYSVIHGGKYPAIIQKRNILATQFHPEKSRESGEQVLKYFVRSVRQ